MKKGQLIVISGFSGAGKGTVVKKLRATHPDEFAVSISATTRAPRVADGEIHGVHYFFVSEERFQEMVDHGDFLEHAFYAGSGHHYGTPRQFVLDTLAKGTHVILEIEIQGALQIKKNYPDALLIFLTAPSASELKRRLINRSTEPLVEIERRLIRAREEAKSMPYYDYILVNDDQDECVRELYDLIRLNGIRSCFQADLIDRMQTELAELDVTSE